MTAIAKALFPLLLVATLAAHEDIDVQVAALTEKISSAPDDSDLFHRRAELHRAHQEFALALADYDRALQLTSDLPASHIGRSSALLATGKPQPALTSADRAASLLPGSPDPHLARARALAALGRSADADKAYTKSTSLNTRPTPELYIEHAQALKNQSPPDLTRAVQILTSGIDSAGPIVTLVSPTIDLHLEAGDAKAALSVLERLPKSLSNTPIWLVRRAGILASLGRIPEARHTYRSAHQAIARLPERRRKTAAMTALLAEIEKAVAALE